MDLRLFERWLLSILPARLHKEVHEPVESIRNDPYGTFCQSVGAFGRFLFHTNDDEVKTGFISGVLIGVCLVKAFERQKDALTKGFEHAIDENGRHKGENVINFFDEKARKR